MQNSILLAAHKGQLSILHAFVAGELAVQTKDCLQVGRVLGQHNINSSSSWDQPSAGRLPVPQRDMLAHLPAASQQALRQHPTRYVATEGTGQSIARLSCSAASWAHTCATAAAARVCLSLRCL
jgi:hypothetical protein